MKRVSFKQYQILKAIYENVIVVSASDNEALIFIRKQKYIKVNTNIENIKKGQTVEIMTKRQKEIIKDNLNAYIANFGYIKIEKEDYGKGFYIFTDEQRVEQGSWTQYCYNIDYLNGWLYGAVQAVNGIMKPIQKAEV